MLGDGFFIRHTFAAENTWYLPNYWHAGEDWYRIDGDTAGASVCAIGDGEIIFAGSDYPGLVRIVRHAEELYSMYGHLEFDTIVQVGDRVARGQPIGSVLQRGDAIPNHLHFEVRSFLTTTDVNGTNPRYGFACGPDCPPGPGYWPMSAPDLPDEVGWLNPTHIIAGRTAGVDGAGGRLVVPSQPAQRIAMIWSEPDDDPTAEQLGEVGLEPGATYPQVDLLVGAEAPGETSAEAYRLWYRIVADGVEGWVRGAVADTFETGTDGRASTVRFNLLPELLFADGSS